LEYNTTMAQTIGQQLQQIRESQGLSLEELSQITHIKILYLEALEKGNVEALPSQTHLRGFLRLYAATLGVDLDELIALSNIADAREELKEQPEEAVQLPSLEEESSQEAPETASPLSGFKRRFKEFGHKIRRIKIPKIKKDKVRPLPQTPGIEGTDDRTSGEIFAEIGAQLEQRRNLISLSLEDIESQTHIRSQFLTAIEKGQFDLIPSPVQARGMLANYAGFLSMDVDDLLLAYADGLQKRRLETINVSPRKQAVKRDFSYPAAFEELPFIGPPGDHCDFPCICGICGLGCQPHPFCRCACHLANRLTRCVGCAFSHGDTHTRDYGNA